MQWIYIICFALISAGLLALFGVRPGDFIDALFRSQRKAATPVSYTHLDVYKRQPTGSTMW